MFNQIFVEKQICESTPVKNILTHFQDVPVTTIDRYDSYWGKFKKPYLQKRDNLNLYLAEKRGQMIKLAPDAYGVAGEPHYYFIHSYNCIYECQYCYLQGYFHTPDLVFFVNHEDILQEMDGVYNQHAGKVWFHAGEFSDSLALSHLTQELPIYFDYFSRRPRAQMELRTKSANIRELLKLNPLPNITVSFSLAPDVTAKRVELKAAPLRARLNALSTLQKGGFRTAIHLDPIIYTASFVTDYAQLLNQISEACDIHKIDYVSMGVVRFTKDVLRQVEKNYPDSVILAQPMSKNPGGMIKYDTKTKNAVLKCVYDLAIERGFSKNQIYYCMEDSPTDTKLSTENKL